MTKETIAENFIKAAINMDIRAAKESTKEALNEGIDPYEFIETAITKALEIIGEKFENEEFFLPDLFIAAEIVKKAMKILEHHIKCSAKKKYL